MLDDGTETKWFSLYNSWGIHYRAGHSVESRNIVEEETDTHEDSGTSNSINAADDTVNDTAQVDSDAVAWLHRLGLLFLNGRRHESATESFISKQNKSKIKK